MAAGKLVTEWTPVKFDGRYELSAQQTELKLRKGDSRNEDVVFSDKAIALQLSKKDDEKYFEFDDGLMIQFEHSKPQHVSYFCRTSNAKDAETCDVRLLNIDNQKSNYTVVDENKASQRR